jgi:hypothetical protein
MGERKAIAAIVGSLLAISCAQAQDRQYSIGTAYTVQASTVQYRFRLDSATFAVEYGEKDHPLFAPRGSKLLVLKYTLSNPGGWDLSVPPGLVRFGIFKKGERFQDLNGSRALTFSSNVASLPKGRARTETAYLEVPSSVEAPILLAQVGGSDFLPFDLSGKVGRLTGPFAAGDGLQAVDDATVSLGQKISTGSLELSVDKVSTQSAGIPVISIEGYPLTPIEPAYEERLLVVSVSVKNRLKYPLQMQSVVSAQVKDVSGVTGPIPAATLIGATNTAVNGLLKPGDVTGLRLVFKLPASFVPDNLTLFDEVGGRRGVVVSNLTHESTRLSLRKRGSGQ